MSANGQRLAAYGCATRIFKPLLNVLLAAGLDASDANEICTRHAKAYARQRKRRKLRPLPFETSLEHVVSRWSTDPTFLDGNKPAALRYRGRTSFSSLVRLSSTRITAADALKELLRHKLVACGKDGRVRLICPFFPVRSSHAVDLELFTKMTVDFLRTHEFNFLRNPRRGEGLFQRIAHRATTKPGLAADFNRYARQQAQLLLETMDDWLARHDLPERKTGSGRRARLGLGVYVINELLR
jgi:hypothetical protein